MRGEMVTNLCPNSALFARGSWAPRRSRVLAALTERGANDIRDPERLGATPPENKEYKDLPWPIPNGAQTLCKTNCDVVVPNEQ
jgi:hypothetical protein